jgi:general secretion pathway protein I
MAQWAEPGLFGTSEGTSDGAEGFTLIETLAAFTVLALASIALMTGLSHTIAGDERAKMVREASRLAQSKLDIAGIVEPLIPGETVGAFDNGFTWHQVVRLHQPTYPRRPSGFWIEVRVFTTQRNGPATADISLATFRLARASVR